MRNTFFPQYVHRTINSLNDVQYGLPKVNNYIQGMTTYLYKIRLGFFTMIATFNSKNSKHTRISSLFLTSMNRFGDVFIRNLRSSLCLIDFDFKIENQRSNMSIFTQVDVAVNNINLVPGK